LVVACADLSGLVQDPAVKKDDGDLGCMGASQAAALGSGASSAAATARAIEDGAGSTVEKGDFTVSRFQLIAGSHIYMVCWSITLVMRIIGVDRRTTECRCSGAAVTDLLDV
jgi:hypothetical protein